MSRPLWLILSATALLGVVGCSTDASRLNLAPARSPARLMGGETAPLLKPQAAPVLTAYWQALDDQRLDPHVVGGIGRPRVADDIHGWIERALRDVAVPGLQFTDDRAKATLILHPRLLKAYIHGVDVTKSAAVVFEIRYEEEGYPPFIRLYRGQKVGMNWWNSDAELSAALQAALQHALLSVRSDLAGRVKRATIEGVGVARRSPQER